MRTINLRRNGSGIGGFTLIEIMVVLVLIAILAVAVVPNITARNAREDLRRTAYLAVDSLRYCQSMALNDQRVYRWTWDDETKRWGYSREKDSLEFPGEFESISIAGHSGEKLSEHVGLEGIYFALARADAEDEAAPEQAEVSPVINFYPDGHSDSVFIVFQEVASAGKSLPGEPEAVSIQLTGMTASMRIMDGKVTTVEPRAPEVADPNAQPETTPAPSGR